MKKKNANYIRFAAQFHRVCRDLGQETIMINRYARRQYILLKAGIRDVRISDLGVSAWTSSGGAW